MCSHSFQGFFTGGSTDYLTHRTSWLSCANGKWCGQYSRKFKTESQFISASSKYLGSSRPIGWAKICSFEKHQSFFGDIMFKSVGWISEKQFRSYLMHMQIIKEFPWRTSWRERICTLTEIALKQVRCLSARSIKYFHIRLHIRMLVLWEFPNCKS